MYNFVGFRETTYDKEFTHFLRGQEVSLERKSSASVPGLTSQQVEAMVRLGRLPSFKQIATRLKASDVRFSLFSVKYSAIYT